VPMLAVPLMRDQFDCANHVCRMGIGLKADIENITSDDLGVLLTSLINDGGIRERMSVVQAEARLEDSKENGVHFIESFLSSSLG
jgi:UDP:flavonoid glycosyltransferase YjiC (YdhE family)